MRNIPFGQPILGKEEIEAVTRVLKGPQLVHGPSARQFEEDFVAFIGGGHTHSVSSCTSGLHLAYVSLGVGSGDEVILPAQTHVATAHSIEYSGAKPVFVDVDPRTGNINLDLVEKAITSSTKAICVVHYLGLPVDMDRVNGLARKYELLVVEDSALALGARYKGVHVGLLGDAGSFSFYPVKHITTAEGGMFATKHRKLANKVARMKAFGYDKMVGERVVPGLYDVDMLGYNYRMNELEAAVGIEQLKRVNEFLELRHANDEKLRRALEDVTEISLLADGDDVFQHAHYCLVIVLMGAVANKRFEFINGLRAKGVGVSVYYPGPVPQLSYYREKYGLDGKNFPSALKLSEASVALPVGPHLKEGDTDYMVDAVKTSLRELR